MTNVLKNNKRDIFKSISKDEVFEELVKIFGRERVSNKPVDLYPYSYDMTEVEPHIPDFIVISEKVEELTKLVKLCNEHQIPITPYATGNNVGGLTIPQQGGILCDMGIKMKNIIKVDESLMYAIIEPGVTFGQLKNYLNKNHPNLKYAYPFAPPYASVLANALLAGETNDTIHGAMAERINGLEVVLNNGDVVRTGSCFISKDFKDDNWFYRQSIPDLTGLFICWQGTSGLVTKGAIQLWPKMNYNTALAAIVYTPEACSDLQIAIGRTGCCYDIAGINLEVVKMMFDQVHPKKFPEEPSWALLLSIEGQSKEILEAKVKYVKNTFQKVKNTHDRIFLTSYYTFIDLIGSEVNQVYDLPTILPLMYKYNGITWLGSYGDPRKFAPLMEKFYKLYKKYEIEPFMYTKIMNSGHYGLFRIVTRYDKNTELEIVKKLQSEVADILLDHDYVPDKTPSWVVEKMRERCDPNWFKLLERIKSAIDPNGIFNPGKWGL